MRADTQSLRIVRRMAEREAAAHLLHPDLTPPDTSPEPLLFVQVRPCPMCGAERPPGSRDPLIPLRHARLLRPGDKPPANAITIGALACESLTARSALLAVVAAQRMQDPPRFLATRAATVASALARGTLVPSAVLAATDRREAWADRILGIEPARRAPARTCASSLATLPAAARLRSGSYLFGQAATHIDRARPLMRHALWSHFMTPHAAEIFPDELNTYYFRCRSALVQAALR